MNFSHDVILQIKDLTRWYDKKHPLFDKFSFSLKKGEFCILQWVSGSGKTTLVKMLTGYIKPPKASIYHQHEDISRFSAHEMQDYRRAIGTIFQENKLIPDFTVYENITYPLHLYNKKTESINKLYQRIMSLMGMEQKDDRETKTLSWWERQKVALARALMHNPEFIIADEPTGNLDKIASESIADLLLATHKIGNTILLITHDQHLIDYLHTQLSDIRIQPITTAA